MDRKEEQRTTKLQVAEVVIGFWPILKRRGTITSPPPIPTIDANNPEIKAFSTNYLPI